MLTSIESLCSNPLFVTAAVVLSFGLFIFSSYIAFQNARVSTVRSLSSNLEYQTRNIAHSVEAYVEGKKSSVTQMTDFLLVKSFLNNARQDTLENDAAFAAICSMLLTVSDSDKRIAIAWLASLRDNYSLSYNDISWEKNGWKTAERPWYNDTMQTEDIYFSNPYWDFETGDVCVSLVKKVYAPSSESGKQDELVGFAGLDLFFPPIREIMTSIVHDNDAYPILMSYDGSILYHPNKDIVFKGKLKDIDPALAQFENSITKSKTAVRLVNLEQGNNPAYFSYTPIAGTNWSVGIVWKKKSAEKALALFENTLIKALLLNVLLFLMPLILLGGVIVYRKRRFQKMKRLYDTVVNQMQTGVAVIDPRDDTIILSNPAFRRYLEIGADKSIPFSPYRNPLHATDSIIEKASASGDNMNIELMFDGSNHYFSHYFAGFESFDNKKLFLSVLSDVTELTKTQHSLREARDAAEAGSRAKSSFLANMSHEIRTPMNGIIGLTDLLAALVTEPQQVQYIDLIRSSAEALLTVINDILDHSKINAGKLQIESYEFDLHRLIQELSFSFTHSAMQKSVTFQTTVAEDVPLQVWGDAHRLRQVLSNFMSNAVKFTPASGQIEFRIVKLNDPQKADWIYFAVTDTGIGFSDEQKNRLFTPFEQADNSVTRRFGGTGLGLAISKQLVDLMGGIIDCRSLRGKGSVFWCELPLPTADSFELKKEPSSARILLKPMNILVVDDVKVNLIVLASMLQQWGHSTETAENGVQAIERLRLFPYDVVFMDCQMPEMDGYECTRRIRKPETAVLNPKIPIIAVTAHAMAGDKEQCLAAGMDDYITKPIKNKELRNIMFKWEKKLFPKIR